MEREIGQSNRKRKKKRQYFFHQHPYIVLLIYAIVLTGISYISINTSSQIYDYPFHMARIVGLAQSIAHHDYMPNLNFLFTHGSGYAVPMFYGNGMLYIPALVYLMTKMGTYAFTSYAFITILTTAWTSYYSLYQMTQNKTKSILFGMTMATAFPYFGFGMNAAAPFIPILIYCIYKVLFMERLNPLPLGITVALLVQTHIISTVVLGISSALFILFSIHKLTVKKLISFSLSMVIAVGLSIGFILQYLEQNRSQTFFVSWGLRDYPFPSSTILAAGNLLDIINHYNFPIALFFLLAGLLLFKYMKPISRVLLLASVVLLVSASDILPWQSVFRYTFLTVFQYSTRLIYFLPAFIIMALFLADIKYLAKVVAVVQIGSYLISYPFSFLPDTANYKEDYGLVATNIEVMRKQNTQATDAFNDPLNNTYWSSGGEYFNLTINHEHVEDGTINQFIYDDSQATIENVQQGYNNLEFDIVLADGVEDTTITLPRIWYKGYAAIYSDGASGTQPEIAYAHLSKKETAQYKETHKPAVTTKALNDGRATISVSKGGHVQITYRKTVAQIIGFSLQFLSWLSLAFYCGMMYLREKRTVL